MNSNAFNAPWRQLGHRRPHFPSLRICLPCANECSLIVSTSPSTLSTCLQHCGVEPASFHLITRWSNHTEQCRIPTMSTFFFFFSAICDIFLSDCGLVFVICGWVGPSPTCIRGEKIWDERRRNRPSRDIKSLPSSPHAPSEVPLLLPSVLKFFDTNRLRSH